MRIVLASASPRRRELLALLCSDFDVVPSEYDEPQHSAGTSPIEHVLHSASAKAEEIARKMPDAVVIGADTIVALGEEILGKPADADDARRMLRHLSGRKHHVITGLCIKGPGGETLSGYEITEVKFRELSEDMIERYVSTGEPMDKAGAYAIQGLGAPLIEGIKGDYFNVVGLPIYKLSLLLERLGFQVLSDFGA